MKVVSNLHQLDIGPESKNIVVVIHDVNYIHVLEETYQKLKNQSHELKIICLEFDVKRELRAREIPCLSIDDYTNAKAYDDLLSIACKLTMTWYQSSNRSYAVYDGISLGALPQYEMTYFFYEVLKAVRETNLIVEKERPDVIIFLQNPAKEVNGILLTPSEDWHKDAAKLFLNNTLEIYSIEIQRTRPFTDNTWRDFPNKLRGSVKNIARQVIKQVIKWVPSFLDKPLKHNILFSEIGGYTGHGVAWELMRKPQNKVVLLNRAPNRGFIRNFFKKNFNYDILERYANAEINRIVEEEGQHLSKEWLIFRDDPQILERFKFDGISVWDLVKDRLSYLFHTKFPTMVRNIELTKECYDKMKISVIVVPYDTPEFEGMLVQVGNLKDIYSLVVLHGIIEHTEKFFQTPWGIWPLSASQIAVGGEALHNLLVDKGVSEKRIEVTGWPRFDSYLSLDYESKKLKMSRKLNLSFDTKIIFFAIQPSVRGIRFRNIHLSPRELNEILRVVISAMRNFPDACLIIKGRSYADEELSRRIIVETGIQNVKVVTDVDVKSLVCASDVLMTGWSTVGLEAMIAGKPVIIVNLRSNVDFVPYVKLGAGIGVYKAKDLPPAIEKALYDHELIKGMRICQRDFVSQYAHLQDGKASLRVANLIEYSINKERDRGR